MYLLNSPKRPGYVFHAQIQRRFDLVSASDNLTSSEWLLPLKWGLAAEMAFEDGVSLDKLDYIERKAQHYCDAAFNFQCRGSQRLFYLSIRRECDDTWKSSTNLYAFLWSPTTPVEMVLGLKVLGGVNVFHDSGRIRKRFGLTLDTSGASPGQGLLIYGTSKVSIRNDTLYVGGQVLHYETPHLVIPNDSRDTNRTQDTWAVNCFRRRMTH